MAARVESLLHAAAAQDNAEVIKKCAELGVAIDCRAPNVCHDTCRCVASHNAKSTLHSLLSHITHAYPNQL